MQNFNKKRKTVVLGGILAALFAVAVPLDAVAQISYWSTWYYRVQYPQSLAVSLAARNLNGIALNGKSLDDHYIAGVSLDGVTIGKHGDLSLFLKGTKFKRLGPGKIRIRPKRLTRALFEATLDDGTVLPLRINEMERRKDREDPEVIHYLVEYETEEGWQMLCGEDDQGQPMGAIPLLGRWDYSEGTETGGAKIEDDRSFTFACEGYVLHKCVDVGYKPWRSVKVCSESASDCQKVSLAPYHQACTRMMRADFCGNGVSYTEDDVLVALYDSLGIRVDTEEWQFEAEWDEDGAICVNHDRIANMTPECAPYLVDEDCGAQSHFGAGVLLMSEVP